MHQIKLKEKIIFAKDGTLLSDVLMKNGESVEHPCGGRGMCKKCTVVVNGKEELSCQYIVKSDITVGSIDRGEISSQTGATETGELDENVCFALDIGTTTMALAVVSLDESKIVKVITHTNSQRSFGADVMTRIDYCRKNGTKELNAAVISDVNSMIDELNLPCVKKMFVSGNTTMLHLFLNVDCSSMGVAPYTPLFLEGKTQKAEILGINGVDEICLLPSIAAFVGSDLVAGLNFVGPPESNKYNLLIDLGTNAEIVLFSKECYFCTSAAAGPCFEGANISCGMSATNGAIYSYSSNRGVETVGNAPAKGVCGTGLIDIIAELVRDGTIDETGYMECANFEVAEGIFLTQDDIRQYQLAKSAVYSAILTLVRLKNISLDDIENVYLSGGFSAKINVRNAVETGLLPKELADKCVAINNSSLLGTARFACEGNDLSAYTRNAEYIDLSANPTFADLFIESMMFE
ncbi:MAG: DUF4445 domain-containing protein [Clostridia bacterium]|nr:DUF4445 domain-containing protein [Clostridia bacterium]MBQ7046471.1 DUF4445 domain-containing protein [Oscillospiraceae bacterium]